LRAHEQAHPGSVRTVKQVKNPFRRLSNLGENWGDLTNGFWAGIIACMAKSLGNAKITVENQSERYEFRTSDAMISSVDGGATHHLATGYLHDMQSTKKFRVGFFAPDTAPNVSVAESNEQAQGLNAVAQKAKAIERRKLMNARAVEGAILEAERNLKAVEHEFNMAVLEALHTGLTNEDIEKHLDGAKLFGFEGHVETVGRADLDGLYTLDMTN